MATARIGSDAFEYDRDPDRCPICHQGVHPKLLSGNVAWRNGQDTSHILELLFLCPRGECQRGFLAYYRMARGRFGNVEGIFRLFGCAPHVPQPYVPAAEIAGVSPSFGVLYTQSKHAEEIGLDQISGPGYRKALEFLVKDFACKQKPESADKIRASLLGACIRDYVDDSNVKKCAELAAWLGNDETHYVRKWAEKDINDLKQLIRLTEAWVLNCLLTEKYVKDMKEGGKGANQ